MERLFEEQPPHYLEFYLSNLLFLRNRVCFFYAAEKPHSPKSVVRSGSSETRTEWPLTSFVHDASPVNLRRLPNLTNTETRRKFRRIGASLLRKKRIVTKA
jgi:hypothetical protein